MASFEDAKAELKKIHVNQGFKLVDEHAHELYFAFGQSDAPRLVVPQNEINDYAELMDKGNICISPVPTSIEGDNFREHLIEYSGGSQRFLPPNFLRDNPFIFQNAGDGSLRVEVGFPSKFFIGFFRSTDEGVAFFRFRAERFLLRQAPTMSEAFSRLLTIKIFSEQPLTQHERSNATALFEGCLFDLSYMRDTTFQLRNEWRSFQSRRRAIGTRKTISRGPFPLNKTQYDISVLRFYQRGIAAEDTYIQFLSFYHILEYYFISVSDKILYTKLSRLIMDPLFRAEPKHLNKLITATEDHKRSADETEMLKNVFHTYTDEIDVQDFIKKHEQDTKSKIYTDKSDCFGEELEKITLKDGHIFGPLAKRIKTIRNALIHSSDRYERKERYIPGDAADQMLAREIPLLRFIAERVIIATAKPMDVG